MEKETHDILTAMAKEFLSQLEKKNSWGKNEVKELYKDTVLKVLLGEG